MKKCMRNEKGMTLVEVLASLVILSILIISFLSIYSQSAKQNKNSEQVMNATYIAQTYMEKIYLENQHDSFAIFLTKLQRNHLPWNGLEPREIVPGEWVTTPPNYQFNKSEGNYSVLIGLWEPEGVGGKSGRVIVRVYNPKLTNKVKSQMETVLFWGE